MGALEGVQASSQVHLGSLQVPAIEATRGPRSIQLRSRQRRPGSLGRPATGELCDPRDGQGARTHRGVIPTRAGSTRRNAALDDRNGSHKGLSHRGRDQQDVARAALPGSEGCPPGREAIATFTFRESTGGPVVATAGMSTSSKTKEGSCYELILTLPALGKTVELEHGVIVELTENLLGEPLYTPEERQRPYSRRRASPASAAKRERQHAGVADPRRGPTALSTTVARGIAPAVAQGQLTRRRAGGCRAYRQHSAPLIYSRDRLRGPQCWDGGAWSG